jgi:hypothetical protein
VSAVTDRPSQRAAEGRAEPAAAPGRMTFAELVHHHFLWRRAIDGIQVEGIAHGGELHRRYEDALARFEAEHGPIVNAYWCEDVESAVALTLGREDGPLPGTRRTVARFHRVSDWATRGQSEVAHLLHGCDELAVKAHEVLSPKNQRICLQLVVACASHLLSVVDTPARTAAEPFGPDALAIEREELQAARDYYREAANGQAQMIYFAGMGAGAAALIALALIGGGLLGSGGIDSQGFFVALAGGALGALVSVIARVNDGTFSLDYDVSPVYSLFTGALRPFVGALFGLAIYAASASGFLQAFELPTERAERFYFVALIAFVAGFSERWAQDTLTDVAPAARTPGRTPAEQRPAGPADHTPPDPTG